MQEQASREVNDMRTLAQAHAQRAQRLSEEMAMLRAQHMETSRQLDTSKQLQERDEQLEEQLRGLKSEIAFVSPV